VPIIPRVDDNLLAHPATVIVVVVVALCVVIGIAYIGVRTYRNIHVDWKPLDGYYKGASWFGNRPIDPAFITEALQHAESFLIARTHFTAENMALLGHTVRVYVMDTTSWVDGIGQKVAGQQVDFALIVGPDLAALCHEYAHLCEQVFDKFTDYEHSGWAANGIAAANADFDVWLKSRGSAQVKP